MPQSSQQSWAGYARKEVNISTEKYWAKTKPVAADTADASRMVPSRSVRSDWRRNTKSPSRIALSALRSVPRGRFIRILLRWGSRLRWKQHAGVCSPGINLLPLLCTDCESVTQAILKRTAGLLRESNRFSHNLFSVPTRHGKPPKKGAQDCLQGIRRRGRSRFLFYGRRGHRWLTGEAAGGGAMELYR